MKQILTCETRLSTNVVIVQPRSCCS